MAANVGHVTVPMQITIRAGKPARDIATVTTDMKLSIEGEPRPIGASGTIVTPTTGTLRATMVHALREAADEIERQTTEEPEHLARILLDR